MLSIARALMLNPSLLLLDEPSEGLAPMVVAEIIEVIKSLKREGLAILLVEQNLAVCLALADRHYILELGRVAYHDYEGIALDLDERDRLIRDLGPHDAMILKNHGLLTAGRTPTEAMDSCLFETVGCA